MTAKMDISTAELKLHQDIFERVFKAIKEEGVEPRSACGCLTSLAVQLMAQIRGISLVEASMVVAAKSIEATTINEARAQERNKAEGSHAE